MIRCLNTSQDFLKMNPDPFKGKYIMKKTWLEVRNFFGFQCYYSQLPETDRKITFSIDFILNDVVVLPVELDIDIIVPNLVLKTSSQYEFLIADYEREYSLELVVPHRLGIDIFFEMEGKSLSISGRIFLNLKILDNIIRSIGREAEMYV
jgi:hypothetical protein